MMDAVPRTWSSKRFGFFHPGLKALIRASFPESAPQGQPCCRHRRLLQQGPRVFRVFRGGAQSQWPHALIDIDPPSTPPTGNACNSSSVRFAWLCTESMSTQNTSFSSRRRVSKAYFAPAPFSLRPTECEGGNTLSPGPPAGSGTARPRIAIASPSNRVD